MEERIVPSTSAKCQCTHNIRAHTLRSEQFSLIGLFSEYFVFSSIWSKWIPQHNQMNIKTKDILIWNRFFFLHAGYNPKIKLTVHRTFSSNIMLSRPVKYYKRPDVFLRLLHILFFWSPCTIIVFISDEQIILNSTTNEPLWSKLLWSYFLSLTKLT